jgi:hypothetical protein
LVGGRSPSADLELVGEGHGQIEISLLPHSGGWARLGGSGETNIWSPAVVQSHLAYWRSGDLSLRSLSAGGEAMELFVQGGRRKQTGRMAMASVYSTKKKKRPQKLNPVLFREHFG